MGSPQEAPRGKDAALPERSRFSPAETSLAVRAVGDYALSSLRISGANWPTESFHAAWGRIRP